MCASEGMFPKDSVFVIVKLRQRTKMIKSERETHCDSLKRIAFYRAVIAWGMKPEESMRATF